MPPASFPAIAPIEGCIARLIRGERLSSQDRQAAQEAFAQYDSSWTANRDRASDVTRAHYYLVACKMGLIDRSRHGGWAFRFAYMRSALSGIRELLQTSDDPFLLACAVTAAVHEDEFEFARAQLARLEKTHEHWTTYAYKVMRLAVDMKPQYQRFLDQIEEERGDDLPAAPEPIELESRLLGSDVVTKNVFRLAELPVGTPHRDAQQRLTLIQTAADVRVPIPRGRSPLYPVRSETFPIDLRMAVEQTRDPFHRLVHEMFWFWSGDYTGEADDGLRCLLANNADEAEQYWLRNGTTLVAAHNLAVLQTLLAFEDDASEHGWARALTGWTRTLRDPRLQNLLAQRVADIADPRLPPGMIPSICMQLPTIAASIAIDRLVRAAKEGRADAVRRLRAAIDAGGDESTSFRMATDALTKDLRDRVRFLMESVASECTDDILRTPTLISTFIDQVQPVLDLLAVIYPANDDQVLGMHDSVARCILRQDVAFCTKTEDWAASTTLLEHARTVARGEATRAKVSKEMEISKDNLAADNDWVAPHYFDLPPGIVVQLEAARPNAEAANHERAIDVLRAVFLARNREASADLIAAVVKHCAAYTIRKLSTRIWNEASAARRGQWDGIAELALKRLKGGGSKPRADSCTMCGVHIEGQFFTRTYSGTDYEFCVPCNLTLRQRYAAADADFAREANRSHHLDLLAKYFNPHNRHLQKQMAVTDSDVQFVPRSPWELLLDWKFVDVPSVIDDLVARGIPDAQPAMLEWLVDQLSEMSPATQEPTMRRLLEGLSAAEQNGDKDRLRVVLNRIAIFGSDSAMCTALSLARTGIVAGSDRSRFMALALTDDDDSIRTLAKQDLERDSALDLRPILEACHRPPSPSVSTAVELLSSYPAADFEDVPTVGELIAHGLTLVDPALVGRCMELLGVLHPGWMRDDGRDVWLPWLKWSASSGPAPNRQMARALLRDYRQTGIPARLNAFWAGKAQPQRPGEAWWEAEATPARTDGGKDAR